MRPVDVLVTNDDGIDSPGLHALAELAIRLGLRPVIAAPAAESSGTSAGLTAATDDRRLAVERRDLPGLSDIPAFAVAGHPGLIAFAGCSAAFGPRPDVVLSGVNRGPNVGRSILHSGTVGAALTASINDVSALAVSLDVGIGQVEVAHWDTAVEMAAEVLETLLTLAPGTVLNLNVPNLPAAEIGAIASARLADFGAVQSRFKRLDDGPIDVSTVTVDDELEPGTDAALLAAGHPTITALRPVTEDPEIELPDRWFIDLPLARSAE